MEGTRELRSSLHRHVIAVALAGAVLAIGSQPGASSSNTSVREGGIFRISLAPQSGLDYVDPALSYTAPGWALIRYDLRPSHGEPGQAGAGRVSRRA